jgi:glycosyltransferase involved in cell wall biosynthesis
MAEKSVTLGVVAISRNEERDLPGFLRHLISWVDEIVIVDDLSTDKTVELIKSAGSKVRLIQHPMSADGGFAEQRNIGITACQADWVLNMDIDERVTPSLAKEMLAAIAHTELNGFKYSRLNFFLHRPMQTWGWTNWNRPQLARNGCHIFVNRLHERCVIQGEPASVGQLKEIMWHLNDESYQERIHKSVKYASVEAQQLLAGKQRISPVTIFAKPIFEFIKDYVLKFGFRGGVPGLIAAMHSADAVFRAHAVAWDEQNRIPREQLEESIHLLWSQQGAEEILRGNYSS